jgi:GTP pyrophosphokinase
VRAWFHQREAAEAAKAAANRDEPVAVPPSIERDEPRPAPRRAPRRKRGASLVDIEGVGDLPTTMARCCAPMPPAPITGYVTLGRGVTIHRAGCASLARMSKLHPQRVLHVQWNLAADDQMPIRLQVEAYDRRGLLRDVTDLLAQSHLSIEGINSDTDPRDRIATIVLRTAVRDTAQLRELLQKLAKVPNVLRAQRLD